MGEIDIKYVNCTDRNNLIRKENGSGSVFRAERPSVSRAVVSKDIVVIVTV